MALANLAATLPVRRARVPRSAESECACVPEIGTVRTQCPVSIRVQSTTKGPGQPTYHTHLHTNKTILYWCKLHQHLLRATLRTVDECGVFSHSGGAALAGKPARQLISTQLTECCYRTAQRL